MDQTSVVTFIIVFFGLLLVISVNGAYIIGGDIHSDDLMDVKTVNEEESLLSSRIISPDTSELKSDVVTEFETASSQMLEADFPTLASMFYANLPNDYEHTPGVGAHKLHTSGASFNNARKRCIMEGAHLAIINSVAEEKKLADMFRRVPQNEFVNVQSKGEARLGIHDLFEKFEWVTILGDSLYATGYTIWGVTSEGVQQPDNAGGNEDCANLMINYGGMNDVRCDTPYAFFCEIDVPDWG